MFVDTNVLLDVVQDDPVWAQWSQNNLDLLGSTGDLVINSVVYAELSISYKNIEDLEAMLSAARLIVMEIPREALFLAGKSLLTYRRNGGRKTGVLPDFFIGAHAAVVGAPLLTRDSRRYRSYFPTLKVISPQQ